MSEVIQTDTPEERHYKNLQFSAKKSRALFDEAVALQAKYKELGMTDLADAIDTALPSLDSTAISAANKLPELDPYVAEEWTPDVIKPFDDEGDWAVVRDMTRADAHKAIGFESSVINDRAYDDYATKEPALGKTEHVLADDAAWLMPMGRFLNKGCKAIYRKGDVYQLICYQGERKAYRRKP